MIHHDTRLLSLKICGSKILKILQAWGFLLETIWNFVISKFWLRIVDYLILLDIPQHPPQWYEQLLNTTPHRWLRDESKSYQILPCTWCCSQHGFDWRLPRNVPKWKTEYFPWSSYSLLRASPSLGKSKTMRVIHQNLESRGVPWLNLGLERVPVGSFQQKKLLESICNLLSPESNPTSMSGYV